MNGDPLPDDPIAVNLGDATPRRLLVEWANRQDAWVRRLVAETIQSRQEPGEDILDRVYGTFLAEKGLSGHPQPEVPMLVLDAAEPRQDEELELTSLHHIQHVNALAADQSLEFDADLTVLFGQNGSGKTGYARILKRISAVRTPEDILPNAHTPAPAGAVPSAQIEYRLSGQQHSVEWKNQAGLAPFTRISVFDAGAVSLHVDSDLGYVYTPAELALFSHVAAGIRGIQQLIAAEVAELKPGANPLLARFARGTAIYPMIEIENHNPGLVQDSAENSVTTAHVMYALHAFSALSGVLSSAFVVTAFLSGWPSIIAIFINFYTRNKVRGTWLDSHWSWQQRTFWFALIWLIIAFFFAITIIGLVVAFPVIVFNGLWVLYRVVRGWLALKNRRAMPS